MDLILSLLIAPVLRFGVTVLSAGLSTISKTDYSTSELGRSVTSLDRKLASSVLISHVPVAAKLVLIFLAVILYYMQTLL